LFQNDWMRSSYIAAETAIPILKRIGDESGLAIMCSVTGYQAVAEQRYEDALPWLETGLGAARHSAQPAIGWS